MTASLHVEFAKALAICRGCGDFALHEDQTYGDPVGLAKDHVASTGHAVSITVTYYGEVIQDVPVPPRRDDVADTGTVDAGAEPDPAAEAEPAAEAAVPGEAPDDEHGTGADQADEAPADADADGPGGDVGDDPPRAARRPAVRRSVPRGNAKAKPASKRSNGPARR